MHELPIKVWHFLVAHGDEVKLISATVGLFLLGTKGFRHLGIWIQSALDRRRLDWRLGSEAYTNNEILSATSCYIVPDCQNIDPSGSEDWRLTVPVRQDAFSAMDDFLLAGLEQRYALVLADSGMGKTSLLLNYLARHSRSKKRRAQFELAMVPLGQPNADEQIASVSNRPKTVLFLDALDEDTKAIQNHRARVAEIIELTRGFHHVVITCRTQFFPRDEEIPAETGVLRVGPVAAGRSRNYYFYKLYLSPFSDKQIEKFIRKRFSFLRPDRRKKARTIAKRLRDLTARPMILTHIPDILESEARFEYLFQIYEEMVTAWLEREHPLVEDIPALRRFSELLAVEILMKRQIRGSEKVSPEDLDQFLSKFHATDPDAAVDIVRSSLEKWQVQSRSLLNRDAAGNWKFAHRSIMEYLAAITIMYHHRKVPTAVWTDQIMQFCREIAQHERKPDTTDKSLPIPLVPLVNLRRNSHRYPSRNAISSERKTAFRESWPCSYEVDIAYHEAGDQRLMAAVDLIRQDFLTDTVCVLRVLDLATALQWFFCNRPGAERLRELFDYSSPPFRRPTVIEACSLFAIFESQNATLDALFSICGRRLTIVTCDELAGLTLAVVYTKESSKISEDIIQTPGNSSETISQVAVFVGKRDYLSD